MFKIVEFKPKSQNMQINQQGNATRSFRYYSTTNINKRSFKWFEGHINGTRLSNNALFNEIGTYFRKNFSKLPQELNFESFCSALVKPEQLTLLDMGKLGLALAAKKEIKKHTLFLYSGAIKKARMLPDDCTYVLKVIYDKGEHYYIDAKTRGGMLSFAQHAFKNPCEEPVNLFTNKTINKLHLNGLTQPEIAKSNLTPGNFIVKFSEAEKVKKAFVFAYMLTENLKPNDLILLEYGPLTDLEFHPQLFYKDHRKNGLDKIIPLHKYKREAACLPLIYLNQKVLTNISKDLFLSSLKNKQPLVKGTNQAIYKARMGLIETNVLDGSKWGPILKKNTFTLHLGTKLGNDNVKMYFHNPEDKSNPDVVDVVCRLKLEVMMKLALQQLPLDKCGILYTFYKIDTSMAELVFWGVNREQYSKDFQDLVYQLKKTTIS